MFSIKILRPTIFSNKHIVSGVTMSNFDIFPNGLSFSESEIVSYEDVKNYKNIFVENINSNVNNLKFQKQVHSDKIRIISLNSSNLEESDGMITNEKGVILCVKIADCIAVLCYDPINQCIGAFHSGWRGTAAEITVKGINMLKEQFSTKNENLLVYISPCAGAEKYEVGNDVANRFPNSIKKINDEKFLFNIKNEILLQLQKEGIPQKNIEISSICTISNKNFHSFRRDKEKSGRMLAFIGLL